MRAGRRVMKQIQDVVTVRNAANGGADQQDSTHDFREFMGNDSEEIVLARAHTVTVVVVKNARAAAKSNRAIDIGRGGQ